MSILINGLKIIGALYFIRLYNEYLAYAFIVFVVGSMIEQGIIMYQKTKAMNNFIEEAQKILDKRDEDND